MSLDRIRADAIERGITRLCHYTPLRNLVHIATGTHGLLSVKQLSAHERTVFNPVDLGRYDGHPDHISCSIQYPNAWYFAHKQRSATGEARLFPDWVCLLIAPHHLWQDGTLFCARNAAAAGGSLIRAGWEGYAGMFAPQVTGAGGMRKRRRHPRSCTTDAQAEALVRRRIPLEDVLGIVVADSAQAGDTYAALDQLGSPLTERAFVIAPDFFQPHRLRGLADGDLPVESFWDAPSRGVRSGSVSESDD